MNRSLKESLKKLVPDFIVDAYHQKRLNKIEAERINFEKNNRGTAFTCNFCQGSYDRFIPDGEHFEVLKTHNVLAAGYRENCLCPDCGSKDRERNLYAFLIQKTKVFSSDIKMLHIAPEKNLKSVFEQCDSINYINGDLNDKLADCRVDITEIPFEDNTFDVLICNHVLEHVPDDALAMREIQRVLKPGGFAILQVPLSLSLEKTIEDPSIQDPVEKEKRFGQFDHVRIYGKDYFSRLENAGFKLKLHHPATFLSVLDIKQLSIIKDEDIIQCFKN